MLAIFFNEPQMRQAQLQRDQELTGGIVQFLRKVLALVFLDAEHVVDVGGLGGLASEHQRCGSRPWAIGSIDSLLRPLARDAATQTEMLHTTMPLRHP